jgi:hypothetical protein
MGLTTSRCNQIIVYYTGSFTTRALEKKRKQEIAFGCVILKKKKSSLKDIREKTRQLTNQRSTPPRCVCRNLTLLGFHLRKNIFKIFGRLELFLKDVTVKLNL